MIIQADLFHPNAGSALRPPDDPESTWLRFAKINTNISEGPAITEAIFVTILCRLPTSEINFVFDAQLVAAVRTSENSPWNLQITPSGFYTYLQGVPHIRS